MRRAGNASSTAGFSKLVAEAFFSERLSARTTNESQFARGSSVQCPLKNRQNRKRYCNLALALFSAQRDNTIAHMLPTEHHGIATTEACVEQHIKPHARSEERRVGKEW